MMGVVWSVRRIGAEERDSVWATKELALLRAERMFKEDMELSVMIVGPIVFEDGKYVPERERGSDV